MKRSTFITWDQLKVGAVIVVALTIIGVSIFKLGQSAKLFARHYQLISFVPSTAGLREGGQVTVAGLLAGSVKQIELLPVDQDTLRNLKITVELDERVRSQVRRDSRATLQTLGLLGDKVFDITPGTPPYPTLRNGDTLTLGNALDYQQVLVQASGAITQVVDLTRGLQGVVNQVTTGQGTLGALLTQRDLYERLNGTLASTNAVLVRLQNPNGTIGHLLNDPELYNSLNRTLSSADTLVAQIGASDGTVGKLLRDDQLYTKMVSTVSTLDSLVGNMNRANGTMSKLFNDAELYDQLLKTVAELNKVLVDVRRDPKRYTKGLISVF
jgi:phospholipid/cholesterol/gamma-HCH transport system substrate-binding protein